MATLCDTGFVPVPNCDTAINAHVGSAANGTFGESEPAKRQSFGAESDPMGSTADGGSDESGITDMLSLPDSLTHEEASSAYAAQSDDSSQQPGQLPQLCDLHDPSYGSKHKVGLFGNWVVPGALMVGTNPMYRSWNLTITPEQRLQQMIQQHGITVFYSLQRDMEKLLVENFADSMHEASYHPVARRYASEHNPPVTLQFRRFSIQDMGIPQRTGLMPVLAELEQLIKSGHKVYMHCRGGVGRAGTVAACLLVHMYGIKAEEALSRVQQSYQTRGNGTFGLGISPETAGQTEFVRQFEADLRSGQLQKSVATSA